MRSLRDCLQELEDLREEPSHELAIEIVMLSAKLFRDEASRWVESFGNPLADPAASSLLSLTAALNPDVIRQACLDLHGGKSITDAELATSMTRMILQALIVFPEQSDPLH
jgi:hypothetical protein